MTSQLILTEWAAPGSPSTNKHTLYVDSSDSKIKSKDSSGVVKEIADASDIPWNATTTSPWLVELATDEEAATGSDETRYINSKQMKWARSFEIVWGTDYKMCEANNNHSVNGTKTKVKEFVVWKIEWRAWKIMDPYNMWCSFRVKEEHYYSNWPDWHWYVEVNWAQVATWGLPNNETYYIKNIDITVSEWDIVAIYIQWYDSNEQCVIDWWKLEFSLKKIYSHTWTVNLD